MAYDPNFPYGIYPQPYQPNNPYQQRQNTYAFVNGIEGAKSYIVQPNQTVLLMDSEQPVCYMKQSNGLGQSSLRYFKLTEVNENDIRSSILPKVAQNGDFATKKDIESLIKRIEKLEGVKTNE